MIYKRLQTSCSLLWTRHLSGNLLTLKWLSSTCTVNSSSYTSQGTWREICFLVCFYLSKNSQNSVQFSRAHDVKIQIIFRFSSHWVNFFKPQELCFLRFTGTESACNFCRSSSSSWEDWELRFSSSFTVFSAMIWAWKWRHHFFYRRSKKTARKL